MKLIQANIWGGKLQYQVQDFIAAQQADIVCMQEVNDLPGPSGALFATLEEIQRAGNYEHVYMSPTHSYQYMSRTCSYGNAILSKIPFAATDTFFTHGSYRSDFDLTKDDSNIRNCQHVRYELSGTALHVLNHHGYFIPGSKEGNSITQKQMQQIANYISELNGPVILTGDFNLSPESQSLAVFDNLLVSLDKTYRVANTYSGLNIHTEACDNIFISREVAETSFTVVDALISDHQALNLEFEINT